MDTRRLRTGDSLAGLSGLVLLFLLWAPWYGLSDGTRNAWQAFAIVDLWLLLTAALAIAVPVVTALRDAPALPVALDVVCWSVALIGLLLAVIRLLAVPDGDVVTGREWGAFAGTLAVLAVLAAAWRALRDESAPGLRPSPAPQLLDPPPPGAGPPSAKAET